MRTWIVKSVGMSIAAAAHAGFAVLATDRWGWKGLLFALVFVGWIAHCRHLHIIRGDHDEAR